MDATEGLEEKGEMWASSVGSHVVSYSPFPNLTALCVRLVTVHFNCQLDGT